MPRRSRDGWPAPRRSSASDRWPPSPAPWPSLRSRPVLRPAARGWRCVWATVAAKAAPVADAAATRAANLVKTVADVEAALEQTVSTEGVSGALIVKDGHGGLAGKLPPLARRAASTLNAL